MDWKKLKAEYIAGGISYRKLAEKHNVPFHTLRKQAAKEHWRELRDECVAKTATKIVELESDKNALRMERLLRVSDDLLDVVEESIRLHKSGEDVLTRAEYRCLSSTIKDIKDIQNIKTKLDIEEQKARIANLKKQAEKDDNNISEVAVVIAGGDSAWQK